MDGRLLFRYKTGYDEIIRMKITVSKEDLEYAILLAIFSKTGLRLEAKEVVISYIDKSDPYYSVCVDEVEVLIKR
jgi:hypothetical protein